MKKIIAVLILLLPSLSFAGFGGGRDKNKVDLTSAQTICGDKTFCSSQTVFNGKVGVSTTSNPTESLTVEGNGLFTGDVYAIGYHGNATGLTGIALMDPGHGNTLLGPGAGGLYPGVNGTSDVFLGENAGFNVTGGVGSIIIGAGSGSQIQNGSEDIVLGYNSGLALGNFNIIIGGSSGNSFGGGNGNILIGNNLEPQNLENSLNIADMVYGDILSGYVGINEPNPAYRLDVNGDVRASSITADIGFFGDGSGLTNLPGRSSMLSGANLTLGVSTFSYTAPSVNISVKRITVTILSPGSGGGTKTTWACGGDSGNYLSVDTSAGLSAGSHVSSTGTEAVSSGTDFTLQMLFSDEPITPTANVVCEYE